MGGAGGAGAAPGAGPTPGIRFLSWSKGLSALGSGLPPPNGLSERKIEPRVPPPPPACGAAGLVGLAAGAGVFPGANGLLPAGGVGLAGTGLLPGANGLFPAGGVGLAGIGLLPAANGLLPAGGVGFAGTGVGMGVGVLP
jgi:hypothetical protein